MIDRSASYQDQFAVEASDLVAAEADERACIGIVAPFGLTSAGDGKERGSTARAMWAYQAS